MSKCVDNVNGKDLELLFKQKYIMDVQKVDKSNDIFAIITLDAELNKSVPLSVGENGGITSIKLSSNGRYYSDEPPNIIIKPPASPDGKPAKATATMVQKTEGVVPNVNTYWEIGDIKVDDGGTGYDAIADIDKIEIEKKSTAQKKIVYNKTKPIYYLLEKKVSQCNNLTDRWHDWFTIPYYYLGNNNGRKKIDESDKTRGLFKCYKRCDDKYVLNNDNVCESIQTLEGGKYRNYIPYDPLAIICILGSCEKSNYNRGSNVIKGSGVPGNYYYTIENVKKGNDEDINTDVQAKILDSLSNYSSSSNKNKHVATIETDINTSYKIIVEYIKGIIREAENNDLKIKTIIKNNVNDFYQLFDKRDELYISYLNKLKDSTHFKRVLYAKSIAHQTHQNNDSNIYDSDATIVKYLKYLFKYCKFLYFNENNMFAIRLLNYGIYDNDYIKDTKTTINNPDEEDANKNIFSKEPTKINYNPVTVKIDTKHKNIFDDYSNAYELYKSFILTYPIILLLSVGLSVLVMVLYYYNFIYMLISALNLLYILVIGILYLFIVLIACNGIIIRMVVSIIWAAYQGIGYLYSGIMGIFNFPIIGTIIKVILFFILIGLLMNNNLGFIYDIVMYFISTIIYIILGIISIIIYIIYGFISLNPGIIFPSLIIMSILYAYYKIWFNFDINTLHKEAKKDTKIISAHSNSETIFKSSVGSAISMARLELYKHSYFMNLYEKAYENYVEKIEEIEGYKANKILLEPSNTTDSEKAAQAAQAEQAEQEKAAEAAVLKNKKAKFDEKVDNANIARSKRREAEKKLIDFDIKNDKTLKDTNMELYKQKLGKSNLNSDEIADIRNKQKAILDNKKDLRQQVSELKASEDKARGAIKPLINENVQKNIDAKKDALSKVFNKQGLMNMGANTFDNYKIDPKALLKA
jgi:hypothetical protein